MDHYTEVKSYSKYEEFLIRNRRTNGVANVYIWL